MAAPSVVSIRLAVVGDAESLALLHVEVWEDAYAELMPPSVFAQRRSSIPERIIRWRQWLTEGPSRTIVAEDHHDLVGFASVRPPHTDDDLVVEELGALYVRSARWGTGVGHALLLAALAQRPAYLWVLHGNDRAIAFYQNFGFIPDGTRRLSDYGTEVRMVK